MLKISELSGYQKVSVLHVKVFQHIHKNVHGMHIHVHDVVHSTNSFTFRSEQGGSHFFNFLERGDHFFSQKFLGGIKNIQ